MDLCQKKQEHLNPDDPSDIGDAWIWRAIALPSHLRVITHLSHGRSEEEAITFLAAFKARTDRKSTRLNSSHVAISYAVFCLKKKKKKRNEFTIICVYAT